MSSLSAQERVENDAPQDGVGKQILIAEDEPVVRRLLQHLLKAWGYRTLVAHDGKEALEVAEKHPGDIDLLLSDITMPRMDGPELAERLTNKRPGVKVILMSGFSHVQVSLRLGWDFIQKPFKPRDIKDKIDKVL